MVIPLDLQSHLHQLCFVLLGELLGAPVISGLLQTYSSIFKKSSLEGISHYRGGF